MRRPVTYGLILLLAWGTETLWSQDVSGIPGAFVDIGVGARPLGMGGAYTAMIAQPNAMFWNPASLARLPQKGVDFSYVNQLGLIPYTAFSGGLSLAGIHSLGLGILASGDEQLKETTILLNYAISLEDVTPSWMSELFLGINLKYHLANFGRGGFDPAKYPLFSDQDLAAGEAAYVSGAASGWGLDLGLIYRVGPRVFIGMAAKDLVSNISWNNEQESYSEGLPARLTMGLSYFVQSTFLVTLDYEHYLNSEAPVRMRAGVEKIILGALALRGGMGQTLAAESRRDYAIGTGFALKMEQVGQLNVDYAYQLHPLANMHRFSVGVRF